MPLENYSELAKVDQRKIWFVTIRRRGAAILRHLDAVPASTWRRAVIDIHKRRHKNIRYLDETVKIRGCPDALWQLAVAGLGRDAPTPCFSNNFEAKPRELIVRDARRNGVEHALGISVNFFHLDCLASEVRLNVDVDVALTVIGTVAIAGWRRSCLVMRRPNRSKCSRGLWPPEEWWRSKGIGLWLGSTKACLTRSFVKPRRIGDDHRSQGWEDCDGFSRILGSSDKSKTVIDFFATEMPTSAKRR